VRACVSVSACMCVCVYSDVGADCSSDVLVFAGMCVCVCVRGWEMEME